MSIDTWKGGNGAWTTAADWTDGIPTSTSAVIVNSGDPHISSAITIASLTNSSSLDFLRAGTSNISGSVTNTGFFNIDDQKGIGGTNLTVGGSFTNTGYMQFGFSDNSLTAKDTIKLGSLVNSIGDIDLSGGKTSAQTLLLDITGGGASFGIANQVTGNVSLSGFSTLEFQSGEFTSIATGALLDIDGPDAFLADAAKLDANSALTELSLIAGTLDLAGGAKISTAGALRNINQLSVSTEGSGSAPTTLAIGAGFFNDDTTSIDEGSAGGSLVTVNGAVTNDGDFFLGSAGLTHNSTVTTKGLINFGFLSLSSALPTAALAMLDVTAAAGFGQVGVLQGAVSVAGNSEIRFASGQITTVARGGELGLFGRTARIADASAPDRSSALTGLKAIEGTLELASGNALTTGALTIGVSGEVDVDTVYAFGGDGGSSLTVNGTVTNAGTFTLGNDKLTGSSNAVVGVFHNTDEGRLVVAGSFAAPERALLTVKTGVAGFGVAGHLTGSVDVEGDASILFASGQITTIDGGSTLALFGSQATIADQTSATTNSALAGLASISGELDIDDGANISTTGNLVNNGTVQIDQNEDGSVLTVKKTLTNHGEMFIGSANNVDDPSKVSAAAINNTGELTLVGGVGPAEYAILNVAGPAGFGAAGHLTGAVSLAERAQILFGGDAVLTTINKGAALILDGATAVIANATSSTTNSALKGLTTNDGEIELSDGANVSTSGGLNSADLIQMDASAFPKVTGGSKLTLGGVLTNSGQLNVGTAGNTSGDTLTATGLSNSGMISLFGASSAAQALINLTGAAGFGTAGVLSGSLTEGGDATVHFTSGLISDIASGATLDLEGAHAFVSEAAVAGNSALDGLRDVAGSFTLNSGAKVATTAGLSVEGFVNVDAGAFGGGGTGGSQLNVGGALVNKGIVNIGNSAITHAVLAFSKLLTNNGELTITGGATTAAKAELDVSGAAGVGAAGVLSGTITLSGHSALRFASGLITTLQSGASLALDGANAIVASGASTFSNALVGLTSIAGDLTMDDGAHFSTTGALGVTGEELNIDTGFENSGGSTITVGGALTNSSFDLSIGISSMTRTSQITAKSLVNNGQITLNGGGATTAQALIDITGAAGFGAAGVLQGTVDLSGFSAVEFASGAITAVAAGATLSLDGAHALIEKGATNSNSALASLTSNSGSVTLENGAVVALTGSFTNNSELSLDTSGAGGSQFKVGGALTNASEMFIGNLGDTSQAFVSAGSLINDAFTSIDLTRGTSGNAELAVSGSIVNDGEFDISNGDVETLNGAVTGTNGTFNLSSGSTLVFGGSVGSGQTVNFSGADQLKLAASATAFAAAISGFGAGDTVDLTTFKTGTTHSFAGGVLTLKSGANTAHLNFGGSSVASEFSISSTAAGTIIAHH